MFQKKTIINNHHALHELLTVKMAMTKIFTIGGLSTIFVWGILFFINLAQVVSS